MTNLLLTLAASLIINLAVLAALRLGLHDGRAGRHGGWDSHQPC